MKKLLLTPLMAFIFLAVAMKSDAHWNLTGNSNATATSVLGTTNAVPLNLMTSNATRFTIDVTGKVGINTTTPIGALTIRSGTVNIPTASWVNSGKPVFVAFAENQIGNADYILAMASNILNARPVFVGRRARGTIKCST